MRINFLTSYPPLFAKRFLNNKGDNFASNPIKGLSADVFEKNSASLVSFRGEIQKQNTSKPREATDFDVKAIPFIRCPVCSQITMTYKNAQEYINNVAYKKGEDLVEAIDKYGEEYYWTQKEESKGKTIYRENVQDILNVVKRLALENPELDLKEIVRKAANESLPDLIHAQKSVLGEIEIYALNKIQSKNCRNEVIGLVEEHRKRIEGKSAPDFKRKTFLSDLDKIPMKKHHKLQLSLIAKKLPASTNSKDSFFVKYSKNRSLEEIAQRFVIENRPTGEHIQPHSEEGIDEIENYICDCAYCNSKRGNVPFGVWAASIPNFEQNLQEYLLDVSNAAKDSTLSKEYEDYIQKIIEVIERYSFGAIKLVEPQEYEKMKIEANKMSLEQKELQIIQKMVRIDELQSQITELKNAMAASYADTARYRAQLRNAAQSEKDMLQTKINKGEKQQKDYKTKLNCIRGELKSLENEIKKNEE